MRALRLLSAFVFGYLLGTVPSGDLAARAASGGRVDLRRSGSRNPGAVDDPAPRSRAGTCGGRRGHREGLRGVLGRARGRRRHRRAYRRRDGRSRALLPVLNSFREARASRRASAMPLHLPGGGAARPRRRDRCRPRAGASPARARLHSSRLGRVAPGQRGLVEAPPAQLLGPDADRSAPARERGDGRHCRHAVRAGATSSATRTISRSVAERGRDLHRLELAALTRCGRRPPCRRRPCLGDARRRALRRGDVLARLVLRAARSGAAATTSQPSPGDLAAAYERAAAGGARTVVSIHLDATVSGVVSSAELAAREAPIPVVVVDTRTVSFGVGLCVRAAAAALAEGGSAGDAARAAARLGGRMRNASSLGSAPEDACPRPRPGRS